VLPNQSRQVHSDASFNSIPGYKSDFPTRRIAVAFRRKSQFPSNTARVVDNEWCVQ
jgi:hypothetical protein